jgi:hypothetical protein
MVPGIKHGRIPPDFFSVVFMGVIGTLQKRTSEIKKRLPF